MANDVFAFDLTRDLIDNGPLFDSADHAAMVALTTDVACFLTAMGINPGERLERLSDLGHDLHAAMFSRSAGTAVMLTWNGEALHLHVSDDDDRLAAIEVEAREAGASVYGAVPSRMRAYVGETGRYAARLH